MPAGFLGWFVSPSNIIFALGLIGLVFSFLGWRALAMKLFFVGYLLFAILAISPTAYALLLPLEDRFVRSNASYGAPVGIIVLGGAIDSYLSEMRGDFALAEAAERLTTVAVLARQYPHATIVVSGGSARPYPPEADVAVQFLESLGVAPERFRVENRSLTTAENAQFVKALIDPKPTERWLLVTSAAHMPRAIGAFRKVGFRVEAYPVDWQTAGPIDLLSFAASPLTKLRLCDMALHEWLGLLIYRLTGKTDELFPGPS